MTQNFSFLQKTPSRYLHFSSFPPKWRACAYSDRSIRRKKSLHSTVMKYPHSHMCVQKGLPETASFHILYITPQQIVTITPWQIQHAHANIHAGTPQNFFCGNSESKDSEYVVSHTMKEGESGKARTHRHTDKRTEAMPKCTHFVTHGTFTFDWSRLFDNKSLRQQSLAQSQPWNSCRYKISTAHSQRYWLASVPVEVHWLFITC